MVTMENVLLYEMALEQAQNELQHIEDFWTYQKEVEKLAKKYYKELLEECGMI